MKAVCEEWIMYELSDEFYTDNELEIMQRKLVIGPDWYDAGKYRLCMYKLYSKNGFTGKVLLIATDDVATTCKAINRFWADSGITATIGEMSESAVDMYTVSTVYNVLKNSRYDTKFPELPGADKVFTYKVWFGNLLSNI